MRQTFRVFLTVVAAGFLSSAFGRDRKANTGKAADHRTPGQYFKEHQSSTITPHGKILTDSVQEKDGMIEYQTEDGKHWRVNHSRRADGKYQYGKPEEVKKFRCQHCSVAHEEQAIS